VSAVTARGLRKSFGRALALAGIDLSFEHGRIVGLIGPNGAGKTTALQAMTGLVPFEGELTVLGRDPWRERSALMRDVGFIADVAILPRWIRVSQLLDYLDGVHPRFDRRTADRLLAEAQIEGRDKVADLSKGMITQVHLSLIMAVDARLLVLDEPTLGLDLLFRKKFYDALLNDYFDGDRTIVLATHHVDEVQHVLTDVVFMDRGRVVLQCSTDELESRFVEVVVHPSQTEAARALGPIHERSSFAQSVFLFDGGADRRILAKLGELRAPGLPDLFASLMERPTPARKDAVR
jgi:ABC-2 type transport system ATP-binding protein